MDEGVTATRGETVGHAELKRLAVLWAQAQGYAACAVEVSLPRSRYRADVAAFRLAPNECSAIFECKQTAPDLRRDNCCTLRAQARLETMQSRRQILEKHLRVHYPGLHRNESLFAEFDSHDFAAIGHHNYSQVIRKLTALQNQLRDGTKFEKLIQYRCANLFFLVLPNELFRSTEIPVGWGALIEENGALTLGHKPFWHERSREDQICFLHRIAVAGTRALNRRLEITFDDALTARCRPWL